MKALIIRSCHIMQFNYICRQLKGMYDKLKITAIVQKDMLEEIKKEGLIEQVILSERAGVWSLTNLGKNVLRKIRSEKYDIMVVPYNNHTGVRYLKVELIASVIRSGKILTFMTDGRKKIYSGLSWKLNILKKVIWKTADFILFAVLALLLLVLFAVFKIWFSLIPVLKDRRKITFITPQNYNYPSARVRCYDFAEVLKRENFSCQVLAYDNLLIMRGRNDPIPEEMADMRKLVVNLVAFFRLLFWDTSSVYYIQKVKYNALAPYLVSLIKKVKLVIDLDDDEFSSPVFDFFPSRNLLKIIAKKDGIGVAASKQLQELMQDFLPEVFFIPTVVDLKKFRVAGKAAAHPGQVVFCWSGIVFGPPVLENIEYIMECFKKISENFSNVLLRLALRGPLLDLFLESREKNYKECNIELVDWLPIDKMSDFYNSADIGLNPLIRDAPFTRCKSPTKLFEYMACGLPSITHNIGEARFIIKDGENGFLADNQNDFIKKMEILLKDSGLRESMGQKARIAVEEKYSLKSINLSLLKVIESCGPKLRGETCRL